MKPVKKHDDLKPYKMFGLSILQFMGIIIVVTLSACFLYNLFA